MDLTLATTVHFPRPDNYQTNVQATVSDYSSSQWSEDLLSSLEQSLARHVGPVAKLLVKKNSKSANSIEELMASLTRHIPNEDERGQFIKSMGNSGISQSAATSNSGSQASTPSQRTTMETQGISESQQQTLTKILAVYAGPLAGRLVTKASKKYHDFDRVVNALSGHISDEKERNEFLVKADKNLG